MPSGGYRGDGGGRLENDKMRVVEARGWELM